MLDFNFVLPKHRRVTTSSIAELDGVQTIILLLVSQIILTIPWIVCVLPVPG